MNFGKQLKEGLLTQNPVLVQLLGMCSTMAITTSLFNGLGMGVSVTIILICANVVISLLRKVIPNKIRIAAYVVVIAGFVTAVDLLLQAYLPDLSNSLGVFIPLIVVNCIILGRAEAFASKNNVLASAADGDPVGQEPERGADERTGDDEEGDHVSSSPASSSSRTESDGCSTARAAIRPSSTHVTPPSTEIST